MDARSLGRELRIGAGLQEGTLQHLQMLQYQSNSLEEIMEGTQKVQDDLAQLREESQNLLKRRHELATKLATQATSRTLYDALLEEKEKADEANPTGGEDEVGVDSLREQVRNALKRQRADCETLLYRLMGQSLVPIAKDEYGTLPLLLLNGTHAAEMAIRLETCYQGRYLERYYVVLAYSKTDLQPRGRVAVQKHTLPHFVPVQQLAEKCLNSDLIEFVSRLHEHLDALVSRREDLKHLQTEFPNAITKVNSSAAFDSIEFHVTLSQEEEREFEVKLEYSELTHFLPSKVAVKLAGKPTTEQQQQQQLEREAEKWLRERSPLEALRTTLLKDE